LTKKNKLQTLLKMQERVGENYTTLDENGALKIFEAPEEMVEYFVNFRLEYYGLRKERTIQRLERDLTISSNKRRFIEEILAGRLKINNRPKKDIEVDLEKMQFDKEDSSYNYLLNMAIHSLTKERAEELFSLYQKKVAELEKAKKTTPNQMYETDLKVLLKRVRS